MKKAIILRRELDLWKVAWQQVDTFLDRIDGQRHQDEPYAKRCHALLTVARVIEHQRAFFFDDKPLSDPVVDRLPGSWRHPDEKESNAVTAFGAWGTDLRIWRIPGSDELELAVGNLYINENGDLEDSVCLRGRIDLKLEQRVEEDDPRYPNNGQGLISVQLPSYPESKAGQPIVVPGADAGCANSKIDVASKNHNGNEIVSLFPQHRRKDATLNNLGEDEDASLSWSQLCAARRVHRRDAASGEVCYAGGNGELPWSPERLTDGLNVVTEVRSGAALGAGEGVDKLAGVVAAANGAISWLADDAADLKSSVDTLDEEGGADLTLPTVDELIDQKNAFGAVANCAGALLTTLSSSFGDQFAAMSTQILRTTQAIDLANALTELAKLEPSNALLRTEPEKGALASELDAVIATRIAYPDGSLRLLRALEWMFLDVWPARRRWLKQRYQRVLEPALRRFRRPFIDGLRALVQGRDTGLPCVGLELATSVPVSAESLPTTQPASMQDAVRDIEAGHVAIIGGDRPTAAVILGLGKEAGKLTVNTAPLRVSVATEGPGSAGLVSAGLTLECEAAGLSAEELRLGESARGPAADGLVQEAVALWSRLALVFGWLTVEKELQPDAGLDESDYGRRLIPEPSGQPLHEIQLYGRIPPNTLGLAIRGLGPAFWERELGEEPLPLLARPGELLLLRGRAEAAEEGKTSPLVQVVVEVESSYRTTGALLSRMDPEQVAQLSTTPQSAEEQDACRLRCLPEEDIAMLVLRHTWLTDKTLVDEIGLGRKFAGFDAPSLATETLLPTRLVGTITGITPNDGGYDRSGEYRAAQQQLAAWTRYAR